MISFKSNESSLTGLLPLVGIRSGVAKRMMTKSEGNSDMSNEIFPPARPADCYDCRPKGIDRDLSSLRI